MEKTITIPLSVAELICRAYLPLDLVRVRKADPKVVEAARIFKSEVRRAGGTCRDPR